MFLKPNQGGCSPAPPKDFTARWSVFAKMDTKKTRGERISNSADPFEQYIYIYTYFKKVLIKSYQILYMYVCQDDM